MILNDLKFRKKVFIFLFFTGVCCADVNAQYAPVKDEVVISKDTSEVADKSYYVMAVHAGIAGGSVIALNELWYKDNPRSSFHFFNDGREWLQMDKAGHVMTSYYISNLCYSSMKFAGAQEKFSAYYAPGVAVAYMSAIEVLDGFSKAWGFSAWDFASDIAGASVFAFQQARWKEQRITLKYTYHNTKYAGYRPALLGSNLQEKLLKDYNGQTYWMSANISSFCKKGNKIPSWLNIAVGYGAEGMTGGNGNPYMYSGEIMPEFKRTRQFYLSPDVDLTKIPVRSKLLHNAFIVLNFIKIPAPALEIRDNGFVKIHPFYF